MQLQFINTGSSPNDGTGDTLRIGSSKINSNFVIVSSSIETLSSQVTDQSMSIELKINKSDLIAGNGISIDSSSNQYIISSTSTQTSFDFRDVYLFS